MLQKHKVQETNVDSLKIKVYDSSRALGEAAADYVAQRLKAIIDSQGYANLIFATGASQLNFLEALKTIDSIGWSNITTFHLDEYVGISSRHRASFRKYLHERIIDEVRPGKSFFLHGDAKDIPKEIKRYENLLKAHPIDIACIGIGENGHLAFNDPPVADFEDPQWVKVVDLDERSRQQQVDEGWFETLDEVPKQALTMTIPAIMQSRTISCMVPDQRKADAVFQALDGPVSTKIPASILRNHSNATLFLDRHSASGLETGHRG